ncbi:MAG TPA: ribosome-associated translation inhibitor RaiA [Terriglobales bacterium]|nr:ribosome-associated translation inhibitor RaiA [Terriglobales bacterium]
MNVEFTGRQHKVTPANRKEVETGLAKIQKLLGDKFETKVILTVEKHRHKAEITLAAPKGQLVAIAQAADMTSAIGEALDHLQKQAVKYKTRWRTKKRNQQRKWESKTDIEETAAVANPSENTIVSVVVHKFPAIAKTTDVHLTHSSDSVAMRPMTLEEAIKEAHFRDRDVFVFRDPKGKVMVLHRTRDGKMELIEAP